jgi:microcystin-dependent protein
MEGRMSDPFVGQIMQVGFNFAPVGWASCNGQVVSISQNNALFALLGTTFGGNGTTTFCLPDAGGRSLLGLGQNRGGQTYVWGEAAGTESVTLTISNMPAHNHPATFAGTAGNMTATGTIQAASTANNQTATPVEGSLLANCANAGPNAVRIYAPPGTTGTVVNLAGVAVNGGNFTPHGSVVVGTNGSNVPFSIMNPYLAVQTNIALFGTYPTRG